MALSETELERLADLVCERLRGVLIQKPVGVEGLADFLGVEPSWVYGKRDLPHFKAGKHKRFMINEVLDFLRCKCQQGQEVCNVEKTV